MSRIDYQRELNAEQYAVVCHPGGPCVVLAGAGSGKTRTIVYRVAWLIEHGVSPESILLLTFTNKAAGEMMQRIHELAGAQGVWGGTFHSIANRLLRRYADEIGFTPQFAILDEEDARALIKACMKELGIDPKAKRFPSPAVVGHLMSYARNAMIGLSEATAKLHPKFEPLLEDIGRIAETYDRKKRLSNAMDFDDLLTRLHDLLVREPAVRQRLMERFRHVLVDEYQDTNAIQASIVRLLAGETGNITVVGDDAQSIYSFRAAEIRNILDFRKQFPGSRMYKLETNYRSTPQILDLANDVISRNVEQFSKDLVSVKKAKAKPRIVPAPSAAREAEFVADEVERLLSEGIPAREIAVLFRATHHSQALEFELMKRSVAYDYRGGVRFFERAHVKDALAFLRIAVNVTDEAAWLRLLGIQVGIGEVSAARIFTAVRQCGSLADAAVAPVDEIVGQKVAKGWEDLRASLEAMRAAGERPADLVRAALDSPYADYLEAEFPNYAERVEDLEQLAAFAEHYDTVPDFLADITLDSARGLSPKGTVPDVNKIVLSTIHQAKGLEWEAVFLIHLTDSGFPNRRALLEDGGLEEERRLFYVAITRAKSHLSLSYPLTAGYDSYGMESPSLFLQECDPNCVDRSLVKESGWGGLVMRRADGDQGGFADDDPVIQVGDDEDPIAAVSERMKKVNKEWKKRSFLRDV
jgi:DNA helicase-2/ATP-dependent DNA helicase PcrA